VVIRIKNNELRITRVDIEEIKQNLFSTKTECIMNSEYEFLYRDTIDFILDQYQKFSNKIEDKKALEHMLPIAVQSDFVIKNEDQFENLLDAKIEETLLQAKPVSSITKIIDYPAQDENALARLILLRYSRLNSDQIREKIPMLTIEQKETIYQHYLQADPNRQILDFIPYTIELTTDILTIQKIKKLLNGNVLTQPFSIHHGYYTPDEILNSDDHGEYILMMKRALDAYKKMSPQLSTKAFYIVPLAFMQKVIFTISINKLKTWDFPFVEDVLMQIKHVNPTVFQGLN